MRNTPANIHMACPCGAKAAVFQNGDSRWFGHCVSCGRLVFWTSSQLTERVRAGGKLCSHDPKLKVCKNGTSQTSWCSVCRVRVFAPIRAGR